MAKKANCKFEYLVSDILNNEYFLETKKDLHHGTNKYEHSLRVAKLSYRLSKLFKANVKSTTRAGLLHDFFIGTRKEKEENSYLNHPHTAAINAKKFFNVNLLEEDAIKTHMFHHVMIKKVLPFINRKEKANFEEMKPKSKEGWIVCISDLIISGIELERFQFTYIANTILLLLFNIIMFKN
ncbi:MAG: HD domain-containing protein [Firmicutes bacterium]|nr:HD domain-containing protein [Bacillota bacterium]